MKSAVPLQNENLSSTCYSIGRYFFRFVFGIFKRRIEPRSRRIEFEKRRIEFKNRRIEPQIKRIELKKRRIKKPQLFSTQQPLHKYTIHTYLTIYISCKYHYFN